MIGFSGGMPARCGAAMAKRSANDSRDTGLLRPRGVSSSIVSAHSHGSEPSAVTNDPVIGDTKAKFTHPDTTFARTAERQLEHRNA